METPLDVLSRAASFVHANEEESKFSHNAGVPLVFGCLSGGLCCQEVNCGQIICMIRVAFHIDEVQHYVQRQAPALFSDRRQ